jgi:hypothetical protein
MAWCVESGNFDGADIERLLVRRCLVDLCAVATADDGERVVLELEGLEAPSMDVGGNSHNLFVSSGMVVVTIDMLRAPRYKSMCLLVSVYDCRELKSGFYLLVKNWENSLYTRYQ